MVGDNSKKKRRGGHSRRHDRNKFRKFTNPTVQRNDLGSGHKGILISCTPHREHQAFQEAVTMLGKYCEIEGDGQYPTTQAMGTTDASDMNAGCNTEGDSKAVPEEKGKSKAQSPIEKTALASEEAKTQSAPEKLGDDDISKALREELADIRDPKKRLFTRIDAGVKGSLFICVNDADVKLENLVEQALREARASKSPNSRHCIRIMPIHGTCYAKPEEAARVATDVVREYFPPVVEGKGVTFAISFKHRLNTGVHRDEYIPAIAKAIEGVDPGYKVDLTKPDVTLLVEVVKTACCIGAFRHFFELAKMNLREAACPSEKKSGKSAVPCAAAVPGKSRDDGKGGETEVKQDTMGQKPVVVGAVNENGRKPVSKVEKSNGGREVGVVGEGKDISTADTKGGVDGRVEEDGVAEGAQDRTNEGEAGEVATSVRIVEKKEQGTG